GPRGVAARSAHCQHLARSAGQAEGGRPHRGRPRPSGDVLHLAQQETRWDLVFESHRSPSLLSVPVPLRVPALCRPRSSCQFQSRPPRRHSYTNGTVISTRNVIIAIRPNTASSLNATAHAYRNTTSISKMMNVIATR